MTTLPHCFNVINKKISPPYQFIRASPFIRNIFCTTYGTERLFSLLYYASNYLINPEKKKKKVRPVTQLWKLHLQVEDFNSLRSLRTKVWPQEFTKVAKVRQNKFSKWFLARPPKIWSQFKIPRDKDFWSWKLLKTNCAVCILLCCIRLCGVASVLTVKFL